MRDEATVQAAQEHIASRLKAGSSRQQIIRELVGVGWDEKTAKVYVDEVRSAIRAMGGGTSSAVLESIESSTDERTGNALGHFIVGGIVAAVGLGLTYLTYSAGGRTFLIFWGPVIYGLYQLGRGVQELFRGH